jgi:hypothetical protein
MFSSTQQPSGVTFGVVLGVVLFFGYAMSVNAAATTTIATSTATTTVTTATTTAITPVHNAAAVEKEVRAYFADIPVMIDIARCESKFRQFTDSGNVLRGGLSGGMVGIFQLFESIHTKTAKNLGFNLLTIEGNLGYARHLYTESGTTPWASCVPAVVSTPTTVIPTAPVQLSAKNEKIKIELLKQVIVLLKELLKLELAKVR